MYEEVGGDLECDCAGSETLGRYDFGGGRGLTFNTAADGLFALDGFSRKVVGHALGLFLDTSLPLEALQNAIQARKPLSGLIHHSDWGVQYTSHAYIGVLENFGAEISMSRKGNPYDNAKMESFMATLKLEEVELSEYEDFFEIQTQVSKFIDAVYNVKRLHFSLGYVPPIEFEMAYHERMKFEVSL